ncbi:hypothetical protein GQ607_015199 [Colletotrichum asianum]|uniref:Uncharacterized protein n=1 Tax=Colletotrichum asianum TaxID=702518 RepID=A0A8H3VY72_9PEZI|nr:hypothetical protein GQ607_015199 [Colletotrichum asianum]
MRFSLLAIAAAVCVSSTAAEVFLKIGQACASIGDPSVLGVQLQCCRLEQLRKLVRRQGEYSTTCSWIKALSSFAYQILQCQSGDNGRWMATPKGDCDCYCN